MSQTLPHFDPPASTLSLDPPQSLLGTLLEAVRGTSRDLTSGCIKRALLLASVPMVMETVMESIFGLVDVLLVSRLGATAVATVGLSESLITFVQILPLGLAIGATALVSRRIGEKDSEQAAVSAAHALWLGLILSLPVTVAGVLLARQLLSVMGAPAEVLALGVPYARIMLGNTVLITLLILISAVLRGAGDAATSMRALWVGNLLNLVLAPCLLFGVGSLPGMGILGAAVATTLSRLVSVLYQCRALAQGRGRLVIRRHHLRVRQAPLRTLLRLSGSALLQTLLTLSNWLVLMRIVAQFGATALAGYVVAMRLIVFAQQPSWGMSHATGTLVGQSLGARDTLRAERLAWRASFHTALLLGAAALGFLTFAEPLVRAFTHEPAVVFNAARGLRIVSCSLLFYAFGTVLPHAFNGAGDTSTPTVINLVSIWLLQLPLAYVLSGPLHMGPLGVFLAIAVGYCALGLMSAALFRRGHWKARAV